MMHWKLSVGFLLAAPLVANGAALAADGLGDPRAIMRRAEEIRAPESSEMKIKLDTTSRGTETSYTMKLLATTGRRSYSEFLAPSEERGRRMLALGRNYFSTLPDSKRVVPVSRRELIGNSAFAIADLFQIDTEK